MELSDWQTDRVRSYLRAYRMYGRDDGGRYYSWQSICDAVAEYTACKIPRERLRQFVEGYPDKKTGEWITSGLASDRLDAVVVFLTHKENGIMSESELDEPKSLSRPPLQLLEMLGADVAAQHKINGRRLEGRYVTDWLDGAVIRSELVLERYLEQEGLFQVIETEETFDLGLVNVIDDLSFQDRDRERWSIGKFAGWAVLTPEDNLLIFLKAESNGWNHQLLTLGAEKGIKDDQPFGRMTMLRHRFPLILHDTDTDNAEMADRAIQKIADQVHVYERRR